MGDAFVRVALIAQKRYPGDNVTIASNGRFGQEDWQRACRLYRRTTRRNSGTARPRGSPG